MKAAVYLGPGKIEVREVARPRCGPNEVLLRIEACAICGTDVRIFFHGQKNVRPPAITGHEIAATIEELGEGVSAYRAGQHVTVVTVVGCGRCRFCRKGAHNLCVDVRALGYDFSGAFAQYMLVPAQSVHQGSILPIPDAMPFDEASLIEPLSCCVNGQEYLHIGAGDAVVVFGAGPIGSMHVELARSQSATRVILVDPDPGRLEMARERVTAERFVLSSKEDPVKAILDATEGEGGDVVIVACSAPIAQQQALEVAAKQARISYFAGLPKDTPTILFNSNLLHYREMSVYGAYASHATQYLKAAVLIASRKVDARKFITRRIRLEEIAETLQGYKQGRDLKVVVEPWK